MGKTWSRMMTVDDLAHCIRCKAEVLRGVYWCWRGVIVGIRSGVGYGVLVLYPDHLAVGVDVTIQDYGYLHLLSARGIDIGSHTTIDRNLYLHCTYNKEEAHGWFAMGEHSFIGPNAVMGASRGIQVGSHARFAHDVVGSSEKSNCRPQSLLVKAAWLRQTGIVMGDDCWVGSPAVLLDSMCLSTGAVGAACSVVTFDPPPYAIFGVVACFSRYWEDSKAIRCPMAGLPQ